ncbi:rhodanese-like domain-containing protein [Streptomyces sp. RY43-2]|uniref:Rhodanese-like domain-containing protein n=1 Tax=Streptomyces macrolidinus TaxID=2952607 RepID=A0ABT0ZIS0_9ACTN|nr:rhodanese-like domain-containing protein [Streptomyces macrolidinus]MCN9243437.1 rhodanese-like domain-containing protein [Streptomyces macrolidinus]
MAASLTAEQLEPRLGQFTVIDVRSPGEYAGGHIPGALNIPLDKLQRALPDLRAAAERGELAVVCASGARSQTACSQLAAAGIPAFTVVGGTAAWAQGGRPLDRPAGARAVWAMDRQVRLAAGSLVIAGMLVDLALPGARWVSAAIGAGLVFSALSNTCAMGTMLAKLPYNRPRGGTADLDDILGNLRK